MCDCRYVQPEWACELQEGHDGPHTMQVFPEPECNGLCITGADVDVPFFQDGQPGIAYGHRDCPIHGDTPDVTVEEIHAFDKPRCDVHDTALELVVVTTETGVRIPTWRCVICELEISDDQRDGERA